MSELWIHPSAETLFRQLHISEVSDIWKDHYPFEIVNDRGDRQVLRIDLGDKGVFYLKRWRFPHGSKYRFLPGAGDLRRRAGDEFQNLRTLAELGIRVPQPLAFGEESGLWGPVASFLLLEELSGFVCAFEYLRTHPDDWREGVFGIARLMATLHNNGLFYRSPGLKHFYLKPGKEEFAMLDVARLDRGKPGWVRKVLSNWAGLETACEERDLSKVLLPLRNAVHDRGSLDAFFWETYFAHRSTENLGEDFIERVEKLTLVREASREARSTRKRQDKKSTAFY